MVTGEHTIDTWLFRDGDGRPAGRRDHPTERSGLADRPRPCATGSRALDMGRRHAMPAPGPGPHRHDRQRRPVGPRSERHRLDAPVSVAAGPLSMGGPHRAGLPDVPGVVADATTAVAPEVGGLHAGNVRIPLYLLADSRYFSG